MAAPAWLREGQLPAKLGLATKAPVDHPYLPELTSLICQEFYLTRSLILYSMLHHDR